MPDLASVLEQARVPEHSAPFMQAMSQGTAFLEGEYLFLTADDWLMAIGYPLSGEYAHDSFERALAAALRRVPKRLEGVDCWAIGPDLPARLAGHVTDRDTFYILPCDAPVPARLRRPVEIAAEKLTVREGRDFTPAQIEFLSNIVRLYRGEDLEFDHGSEAKWEEVFGDATGYVDVPGLCKAATLREIEAQGWSLNPGRYVGVAQGEEITDEDFKQQLETLNEELESLNAQARELEQTIAANVAGILEA